RHRSTAPRGAGQSEPENGIANRYKRAARWPWLPLGPDPSDGLNRSRKSIDALDGKECLDAADLSVTATPTDGCCAAIHGTSKQPNSGSGPTGHTSCPE